MTLGELTERDGRWQVHFTKHVPHPPEKVWRAITEPDHLAAWFPTTIEGDRAAGAPLRFSFRKGEGPSFEGTMVAFDPPKLMEFEWGPDVIRIELQPDGDGTTITLFDTLDELGKAARDAAGWHECLARLEASLEGRDGDGAIAGSKWSEVQPRYQEKFGPEASTIGPPEGQV